MRFTMCCRPVLTQPAGDGQTHGLLHPLFSNAELVTPLYLAGKAAQIKLGDEIYIQLRGGSKADR